MRSHSTSGQGWLEAEGGLAHAPSTYASSRTTSGGRSGTCEVGPRRSTTGQMSRATQLREDANPRARRLELRRSGGSQRAARRRGLSQQAVNPGAHWTRNATHHLRFHSSTYQWLVVAGSRAQFKGDGEVNGVSG